MRASVSKATLKDLDKLAGPILERKMRGAYAYALGEGIDKVSPQARASFTVGQRTVLRWPRILSLNDFEAVAGRMQDDLIQSGREDCRIKEGDPGPKGLDDASHRHRATR